MSFTGNLKAQLAQKDGGCSMCDISELAAMIRLLATYTKSGVTIQTENEDVAERIGGLIFKIFKMSWKAAPEADVITPILFGMGGRGRFLLSSNNPSADNFAFSCSKAK